MLKQIAISALVAVCCGACFGQQVSLDYYIDAAKKHSPLLHDYRNAILINKIDSQKIRAGYMPQVSLTSNNSYAPSIGNNFGYDPAITNGGQYGTLVTASKTFAGRDNLNTQFRAITLASDSILVTSAIAEQDLIRTVTAQYLAAYGDQQLLITSQEIGRLLSNEDQILKSLTQHNIYRQTDYLTFLVTYKQQELSRKQQGIQYQTDFATLNYLCGIVDTSASSATLTLPNIDAQLFPDMLTSAFFRKYTVDSMRLENDIKLINLAYRPRVSVFADAGYNTTMLNTFYQHFGVSGGVGITWPIFDGGRRKLSIRQVSIQEDTRIAYRDFFVLEYNQQLAQLRQQLHSTENLINDIDEQIKYSRGLIDVNEKLLQTGDARIPDFVIAINNYLTARTLLTQNRISRLQIINQINYWNR